MTKEWLRRVIDRLRVPDGCLRCLTHDVAIPCRCPARCGSLSCGVSRVSEPEWLHTYRVRSDADVLFETIDRDWQEER